MKENVFLKRFEIKELFGIYNVDIPFDSNVNIFVGENGLGKTTILNCINYVLQCDSDNLYNIDFKEIIVTFKNNEKVKICHDDLLTDQMLDIDPRKRHMILSDESITESQSIVSLVKRIYRDLKKDSKSKMNIDDMTMAIMRRIRNNSPYMLSRLHIEKIVQEIESNSQNDWEDKILSQVKNNIIYLPTYRRIEEDFNKCMNNDYKLRNDIIKRISN